MAIENPEADLRRLLLRRHEAMNIDDPAGTASVLGGNRPRENVDRFDRFRSHDGRRATKILQVEGLQELDSIQEQLSAIRGATPDAHPGRCVAGGHPRQALQSSNRVVREAWKGQGEVLGQRQRLAGCLSPEGYLRRSHRDLVEGPREGIEFDDPRPRSSLSLYFEAPRGVANGLGLDPDHLSSRNLQEEGTIFLSLCSST